MDDYDAIACVKEKLEFIEKLQADPHGQARILNDEKHRLIQETYDFINEYGINAFERV